MSNRTRKIISMIIVFVIMFTYTGGTLEAIATTDGISAITNGFFGSEEIEFNAYFEQENNQNIEQVSNVNEKRTIILEVSPKDIGKGFLKEGFIFADGIDGSETNFKFSKIKNVIVNEPEEVIDETSNVETPDYMENEIDSTFEKNTEEENLNEEQNEVEENKEEENLENNTQEEDTDNTKNETVETNTLNMDNESEKEDTTDFDNAVTMENIVSTDEIEEDVVENAIITSRSSEARTTNETILGDELINEEEVIKNIAIETQETYEELTAQDFEIEIIENNQIKIQNVIHNTKIEVEIEYNQNDILNISDLYKQINIQLKGTYININLERIQTEVNQVVTIGWAYNKEFEVSSEYTQVSPFQLGEHTGTIVENKVVVKRQIEDENYLPVKQTMLEIEVPDYNGNAPETVSVQATKLMATRGEDLGEVTFGEENWNYDSENKKITITVTNEQDGKAQNSIGEDEYTIVYRYNDYIENETVTMDINIKATVEEYSSENKITTKEVHNSQEIKTQKNDLITYNIGTTQTELNKAKINANYNSDQAIYETEYTTTVNVNILTSDVLEELKINSSKEFYLDNNQTEFDASQDIYYNKIKFNYSEVKNILKNGATIEIQTLAGQLMYTLTDDLIRK